MRLAVLKYQFVAGAPAGIPLEWPAEIREIGDNDPLPGDDWVRFTIEQYNAHRATYQTAYDTWANSGAIAQAVATKIANAMAFGSQLMIEFATRNILAGLTDNQIGALAAQLKDIQLLLSSGSLKLARTQIMALTPSESLPQAVIDEYAEKLRVYLELPA